MKKKIAVIVAVFAFLATLIGTSYLVYGIQEHGMSDVNYGSVIFPPTITVIAVVMYRREQKADSKNA